MILIFSLLLTGCWDKKELNDISFVIAECIDFDDITGEFIIAIQVVRTEAMQKEGANMQVSPVEIVTSRGKTIYEARKNLTKQFDRKPFFPHCKIIIFTERYARIGVRETLDRLVRAAEIRPLDWLIVAKGASAEEVLSVKAGISRIQGIYLNDIIRWRKDNSESNVMSLQEFTETFLGDEGNPTTGVFEIVRNSKDSKEEKAIKLSGTAVFKKDKLTSYLTDRETKALNFVTGKLKSGSLTVTSPIEQDKVVSCEIKKAKSNIKPEIKNGEYIFNINISLVSELTDQQSTIDTSKPGIIELIEKQQEEFVKNEAKMIIKKAQNEINLDILGFGGSISRSYPKEWDKLKDNWQNVFPKASCNVNVKARIIRTGMLLKPIKTE